MKHIFEKIYTNGKKILYKFFDYPYYLFYSNKDEYERIKKQFGLRNALHFFSSKIYLDITNKLCLISTLPFVIIILMIRPWRKVIFLRLYSAAIGHYALNTEIIVSALHLGIFKFEKNTYILFYHMPYDLSYLRNRFFMSRRHPICNHQLDKMWKRIITLIPYSYLSYCIDRMLCIILGEKYSQHEARLYTENPSYLDRNNLLQSNNSSLKFNTYELEKGKSILQQMGIKENTQYICLFVRDAQYNQERIYYKEGDNDFRNSDSDFYKKSATFLAEKGYYVIRMGSMVAKKFDITHPNVIDYANSKFRSDFMDIYLSAHCYFFISTGSGLDSVAQVFKKPVLYTNIVFPFIFMTHFVRIYLLRKYINRLTGELINLDNIYALIKLHNLHWGNIHNEINNYAFTYIENSENEILDAVKEMVFYLHKKKLPDYDKQYNSLQIQAHRLLIRYGCILSSENSPKCASSFLISNKKMFLNKKEQYSLDSNCDNNQKVLHDNSNH